MIRKGTLADLNALLELERLAFPPKEAYHEWQFRYLLTRAQGVVLVDEEGAQVRGVVVLLWRRGSAGGRIYDVAVHPSHRGKGIARALLEEAEKVATARGLKWLSLEVEETNRPARRLYAGMGFVPGKHLPNYYAEGRHGLRCRKMLS